MKFVKIFRKSPEQKKLRSIYREWDAQREAAKKFGVSHQHEIDAIFARHLDEEKV